MITLSARMRARSRCGGLGGALTYRRWTARVFTIIKTPFSCSFSYPTSKLEIIEQLLFLKSDENQELRKMKIFNFLTLGAFASNKIAAPHR